MSVVNARIAEAQSRLLDADELKEVRSWLGEKKTRDLGVSQDVLDLVAKSKAARAAQVAELAARRRRWRRWVTVALVVLTGAVVAVSTLAPQTAMESSFRDST